MPWANHYSTCVSVVDKNSILYNNICTSSIYWNWCICVQFIFPIHRTGFWVAGNSLIHEKHTHLQSLFHSPRSHTILRVVPQDTICDMARVSSGLLTWGSSPASCLCHDKIALGIVFCWLWKLLALKNLKCVQLALCPANLKILGEVSETVFFPI